MNNDDKTTIRTAAIIGGVIGAILLGLLIKIDGTTKGTVIGVGCLLICGIVGIISYIRTQKERII